MNNLYTISVAYDGAKPHYTQKFADALDAFESFATYVDWGFANEYATYNLYEPSGKCHTKIFWRDGKVSGK